MPLTRPCLKSFITHQIKNNAGLQFVREPVTANGPWERKSNRAKTVKRKVNTKLIPSLTVWVGSFTSPGWQQLLSRCFELGGWHHPAPQPQVGGPRLITRGPRGRPLFFLRPVSSFNQRPEVFWPRSRMRPCWRGAHTSGEKGGGSRFSSQNLIRLWQLSEFKLRKLTNSVYYLRTTTLWSVKRLIDTFIFCLSNNLFFFCLSWLYFPDKII